MDYYEHPHVKTLKAIAENWFLEPGLNSRQSSRTDTPHDARAITRLVSTASWAVQNPYSDTVAEFVKRYRKAQETDLEKMRNGEFVDLFGKFMEDIDRMFFFAQLARNVESKEGSKVRFVRLRVTDKLPEGPWSGSFSQPKEGPLITVFRYSKEGKRHGHYPFEHMLHTLLHEMCHAYLGLFSDNRHRFKEWVDDFEGHGEMFWVLLRFIAEKIGVYTKSERWQDKIDKANDQCYARTKTLGEPGTWGSPEKTLMGGY